MIDEPSMVAPIQTIQKELPPVLIEPGQEPTLTEATPEQVRALDAVFAQQRESQQVQSLLGMWMGTLLLRDLAIEHFDEEPDLEEKPRKEEDLPE